MFPLVKDSSTEKIVFWYLTQGDFLDILLLTSPSVTLPSTLHFNSSLLKNALIGYSSTGHQMPFTQIAILDISIRKNGLIGYNPTGHNDIWPWGNFALARGLNMQTSPEAVTRHKFKTWMLLFSFSVIRSPVLQKRATLRLNHYRLFRPGFMFLLCYISYLQRDLFQISHCQRLTSISYGGRWAPNFFIDYFQCLQVRGDVKQIAWCNTEQLI